MDLMKDFFGSSDPKLESKVQPKSVPKVEPKPVAKVESKPAPKAEPKPVAKVDLKPVTKVESKPATKVEPKSVTKVEPKAQPVDNDKLQQLQQELDQAERDYKDSVWALMSAKQQYYLLSNGYKRDPENSSKDAVYQASADVADCQERQDSIDRKRNSLKKQIAELKGGVTS